MLSEDVDELRIKEAGSTEDGCRLGRTEIAQGTEVGLQQAAEVLPPDCPAVQPQPRLHQFTQRGTGNAMELGASCTPMQSSGEAFAAELPPGTLEKCAVCSNGTSLQEKELVWSPCGHEMLIDYRHTMAW